MEDPVALLAPTASRPAHGQHSDEYSCALFSPLLPAPNQVWIMDIWAFSSAG